MNEIPNDIIELLKHVAYLLNSYDSTVIDELVKLKEKTNALADSLKLLLEHMGKGETVSEESVESLKKAIDSISKEVESFEERFRSMEKDIKSLSESVSSMSEVMSATQIAIAEHEQFMHTITQDIQKQKDEIERNAKEIALEKEKVLQIQEDLSKLDEQTSNTFAIIANLENKINSAMLKLESLESLGNDINSLKQEFFSFAEETKQSLMELWRESEKTREEITKLWEVVNAVKPKSVDTVKKVIEEVRKTDVREEKNVESPLQITAEVQSVLESIKRSNISVYSEVNSFKVFQTTAIPDKADILILHYHTVESVYKGNSTLGLGKIVIGITPSKSSLDVNNNILEIVNQAGGRLFKHIEFVTDKAPFQSIAKRIQALSRQLLEDSEIQREPKGGS
ncbi:MAG: hypothetical protein QXP36_06410 [Conexivisphaerales archaeon]